MKASFEVGSSSDWMISIILVDKRVYNKFEECYIPLYDLSSRSWVFDARYLILRKRDCITFVFHLHNFIRFLGLL